MEVNLVIDADSILYTSCYRNQDIEKQHWFPELAYKDFCSTVSNIESAVYKQYDLQKTDKLNTEIIFSPKKTFRHDLTNSYKANRKPTFIVGIKELKQMVSIRLGMTQIDNMEADDIVITRAYEKENVVIACIDKDIYTHSPVDCFNYKKWEWTEGLSEEQIDTNYWIQALMGDSTDGIKGAKGIGPKTAEKIVYSIDGFDYDKYVSYFDSEEDAVLSMRLVRLDQYKNNKLKLWENE